MADPKVIITIQAQDKASGEIQAIASGVVSNLTKMEQAGSSMSGSFSRLQGVIAAFGASLSVAGISQFAKSIWDTGAKIQSMELAFKSITGTSAGAAAEMDFVRQTAVKLGLDLTTAAQGYKTIAAAAMGTSLAGKGIRDVFVAVSEASAALGLSSQQTEKALLALGQMLSKGKVQAEELRGQLGDAIPIAMQSAAKAVGVTTAKFQELMQEGKLVSEDFVPKLAKVWHEMFSVEALNAANTFQGASNLMATAWTNLKSALADTAAGETAKRMVREIAEATESAAKRINDAKGSIKPFSATDVLGGALSTGWDIDTGGLTEKGFTARTERDKWLQEQIDSYAEIRAKDTAAVAADNKKRAEEAAKIKAWQDQNKKAFGTVTQAPAKTRTGGGGGRSAASTVLDFDDMTKKVETFSGKLTSMYSTLEYSNYDLWISMAKSSGDFYKAADLEVDKWVSGQKAGIDKSLTDSQSYFTEMERNLTSKGGTADAWAKLEEARAQLAETESVAMQQYITLSEQETQKRADSVKALKDEEQQLKKTGNTLDGFRDSWNKWVEETSSGYKAGEELFDKFQSSIDDLAESLAEFTVTGKLSWSDMLTDMAEEAAKFLYKSAFTDLVNAFKGTSTGGSVVSWISSLFGGGSSAAASSTGSFGSAFFNVWHSGGMVGAGGPQRAMSSALMIGAPRLHSGLNPDEFPAILQRGETVIPAGQSAASQTIATNINVSVNQQGKYDQAESQRLGSEVSRMIEQSFNANLQKQLRPGGILNRGING